MKNKEKLPLLYYLSFFLFLFVILSNCPIFIINTRTKKIHTNKCVYAHRTEKTNALRRSTINSEDITHFEPCKICLSHWQKKITELEETSEENNRRKKVKLKKIFPSLLIGKLFWQFNNSGD